MRQKLRTLAAIAVGTLILMAAAADAAVLREIAGDGAVAAVSVRPGR